MAKKGSSSRRTYGVMLNGRTINFHRWRDEIKGDGGKPLLHRIVRQREDKDWRREAGLL